MADELGQRPLTPDELGAQYAAEHPESEADLTPQEPEEAPIEELEAPETPGPAVPNPLEMTPAERRTWLGTASREDIAQAIVAHGDPTEMFFLSADYQRSKTELAQERQRLEAERNLVLGALPQGQQPFGQPSLQPTPAPPPDQQYAPPPQQTDPYTGLPVQPDPAIVAMQQRLDAMERTAREQARMEGLRLIKQEMNGLTQQHPWFSESDHDRLFVEMERQGVYQPTTVFRSVYYDRLMEEAVAKSRGQVVPAGGGARAAATPAVVPPALGQRSPKPPKIDTLASAEDFGKQVAAAGLAKGAG